MSPQARREPEPLRLGTDDRPVLEISDRKAIPHERRAVLRVGAASGTALLTPRGAAALGRWLLDWSRPRRRAELWGPGEIQKRYRIGRSTFAGWRSNPTFPEPVAELSIGPVWEARQVREWAKSRPKRGAPKGNRNAAGRRN